MIPALVSGRSLAAANLPPKGGDMVRSPSQEKVKLWQPGIPALELMRATCVTQRFPRHAHDGFADQSHLARHFKRLTGITPGKYPRIVQEKR